MEGMKMQGAWHGSNRVGKSKKKVTGSIFSFFSSRNLRSCWPIARRVAAAPTKQSNNRLRHELAGHNRRLTRVDNLWSIPRKEQRK
jgi:hypothetical protein